SWSERQGAVVIIAQEAVRADARGRLGLPGKEVVVPQFPAKHTPVLRRELVKRIYFHAVDQSLTGVDEGTVDRDRLATSIACYAEPSRAAPELRPPQARTIRICVCAPPIGIERVGQQHLSFLS